MIGVAISTHRRPHILARALAGWAEAIPDLLVVINDVHGAGVAATKNRGIAALMDAGVTDLFLADDDMWPITEKWFHPYVTNPQPHLMHCWGKSRYLHAAGSCTVWSWPRGVLLYATRQVIETVGGMRLEFGRWGGEHAEWSRRIHNAGLTAHPFQDATAARTGIWHCEDYTRATPSSVPSRFRDAPEAVRRRHALYERFRSTAGFVDYRAATRTPAGSR